jgi:hypothetical protein
VSSAGLQPGALFLFSYDSSAAMDSEFDGFISSFSAVQGAVTQAPSWSTWKFVPDSEGTVRGRIISFISEGVPHFMWTEESTLQIGQIRGGNLDAAQLYDWWTKAGT